MKPYMRDWRVGEIRQPRVTLATAVAASSAFPPVLSPTRLKTDPSRFTPNSGDDLQEAAYTRSVMLSDGGVYDNLGLETAWKRYRTILVSDAGGKMEAEPKPPVNWAGHSLRILEVIDNQVRSLRKRQLIRSYKQGLRAGAYWGIRTDIRNYHIPDALPCPFDRTMDLARTKTRLKRLDPLRQQRLINWGYGVCDAALRKHVDTTLPVPGGFPYPESGV